MIGFDYDIREYFDGMPREYWTYYGEKKRGIGLRYGYELYFLECQVNDNVLDLVQLPADEFKARALKLPHDKYLVPITRSNYSGFQNIQLPFSWQQKKYRKLVIVGAGASYDSILDDSEFQEDKLPLSNELFYKDHFKLFSRYPNIESEVADFKITRNLEMAVKREFDRQISRYNISLHQKLISLQYYLHHIFYVYSELHKANKFSVYGNLVKAASEYIEDSMDINERVAFVSYNYDTLLETSIQRKFSSFNSINNAIADDLPITLLKPHGSCDWMIPLDIGQERDEYVGLPKSGYQREVAEIPKYFESMQYSQGVVNNFMTDQLSMFQHKGALDRGQVNLRVDYAYWPALLIPISTKDQFVMPQQHVSVLDKVLDEVEDILIIGWKGEEQTMLNKMKEKLKGRRVNFHIIGSVRRNSEHDEKRKPHIQVQLEKTLKDATWSFREIGFRQYGINLVNGEGGPEVEFFRR